MSVNFYNLVKLNYIIYYPFIKSMTLKIEGCGF